MSCTWLRSACTVALVKGVSALATGGKTSVPVPNKLNAMIRESLRDIIAPSIQDHSAIALWQQHFSHLINHSSCCFFIGTGSIQRFSFAVTKPNIHILKTRTSQSKARDLKLADLKNGCNLQGTTLQNTFGTRLKRLKRSILGI